MATPVFLAEGEWTVMVGCETLSTPITDLPATRNSLPELLANSGPATECASGAFPGQIATWVCPADGCQTAPCVRIAADGTRSRRADKDRITIHSLQCNSATGWGDRTKRIDDRIQLVDYRDLIALRKWL